MNETSTNLSRLVYTKIYQGWPPPKFMQVGAHNLGRTIIHVVNSPASLKLKGED